MSDNKIPAVSKEELYSNTRDYGSPLMNKDEPYFDMSGADLHLAALTAKMQRLYEQQAGEFRVKINIAYISDIPEDVPEHIDQDIFALNLEILAGSSDYFAGLRKNAFAEKIAGEIELTVGTYESLDQMFRWIYYYGFPTEPTAEQISALFIVADYYQVGTLKDHIISIIGKKINIRTMEFCLDIIEICYNDELVAFATRHVAIILNFKFMPGITHEALPTALHRIKNLPENHSALIFKAFIDHKIEACGVKIDPKGSGKSPITNLLGYFCTKFSSDPIFRGKVKAALGNVFDEQAKLYASETDEIIRNKKVARALWAHFKNSGTLLFNEFAVEFKAKK